VGVFSVIDAWIKADVLLHEQARQRGDMIRAALPGRGFLRFFLIFIVFPLVASEAMYIAGLPALPPPVIILVLFGAFCAFFWRYFTHRRQVKTADEHSDTFE